MKVSPSLYSSSSGTDETVKVIRNTVAEYIHIDIKDCSNLKSVKKDIEIIRKNSDLSVDIHLIEPHPAKYIDEIKVLSPDFLAVQYEDLVDVQDFYKLKDCLLRVGIAIIMKVDFEEVSELVRDSNYVLLMTTTPGESGGSFTDESIQWIESFIERFPGKKVHVDGGVNDIVAEKIRKLKIDCVVSGSYLMKSPSMVASVLKLKGVDASEKLKNHMISADYIPVVRENDSVFDCMKAIECGQRGFCFVFGENKWGIVTDGDIRRFLVSKNPKRNSLGKKAKELTNFKPYKLSVEQDIEGLLKFLIEENIEKKLKFIVLVEYNKPVGIFNMEKITKV